MNVEMKLQLSLNLKKFLKEHDLTVAQLSRATKVPSQTITNWLSGLEPRNMGQVKQVATHLGCTIDELAYGPFRSSDRLEPIKEYQEEINAGIFEVVLRRKK
jgi:transcriptional regulator with XRE-family HTH domain